MSLRHVITEAEVICSAGNDLNAAWNSLKIGGTKLQNGADRFEASSAYYDAFYGLIASDRLSDLYTEYAQKFQHNTIPVKTPDLKSSGPTALFLAKLVALRLLSGKDKSNIKLIVATTKGEIENLDLYSNHKKDLVNLQRFAQLLADELKLPLLPIVVSVACASGLSAIFEGIRYLNKKPQQIALIVGVDVISDFVASGFHSLQAIDNRGTRPFCKDRSGISLGEGAAAVILTTSDNPAITTPLSNWEPIEIKGWAETSDALHITRPDVAGLGLSTAIKKAIKAAGIQNSDIAYINAHGTGTHANDQMETTAITEALNLQNSKNAPLIASLKPAIGHTLGAAGLIETIFTGKMLAANNYIRTPGLETVDSEFAKLNFSQPITNVTNPLVLTLKSGFGGVNAAAVLEKYSA